MNEQQQLEDVIRTSQAEAPVRQPKPKLPKKLRCYNWLKEGHLEGLLLHLYTDDPLTATVPMQAVSNVLQACKYKDSVLVNSGVHIGHSYKGDVLYVTVRFGPPVINREDYKISQRSFRQALAQELGTPGSPAQQELPLEEPAAQPGQVPPAEPTQPSVPAPTGESVELDEGPPSPFGAMRAQIDALRAQSFSAKCLENQVKILASQERIESELRSIYLVVQDLRAELLAAAPTKGTEQA